jgi:hypothetical protein
MSSKRADGDAWQTEHPRRRQLPSRRLERERQEALERRAVIESQRQLQWEDDEDDDNRTYITQDEVIELLRDMERYRQKIAAAASLFEGWLATITAPLPVGSVAPCIPTKARDRPRDDLWLHEIKHDGFRVIARKSGAQWAAKGTAAALVRAASSGWESASGILFMADCLHFHRPDGSRHPYNSGAPAVLVAFGQYDFVRLRKQHCGHDGRAVAAARTTPRGSSRLAREREAALEGTDSNKYREGTQ